MSVNGTEGTVTLALSGMSCGSCRRHVEEALRAVEGVRDAGYGAIPAAAE